MAPTKCKRHPQYQAINKPRRSKDFPEGCDKCWAYYRDRKHVAELEAAGKVREKPTQAATIKAMDGKKLVNAKLMKVVRDELSDQYEIMYGRRCMFVASTMDDVDSFLVGFKEGLGFNASIGQE